MLDWEQSYTDLAKRYAGYVGLGVGGIAIARKPKKPLGYIAAAIGLLFLLSNRGWGSDGDGGSSNSSGNPVWVQFGPVTDQTWDAFIGYGDTTIDHISVTPSQDAAQEMLNRVYSSAQLALASTPAESIEIALGDVNEQFSSDLYQSLITLGVPVVRI